MIWLAIFATFATGLLIGWSMRRALEIGRTNDE